MDLDGDSDDYDDGDEDEIDEDDRDGQGNNVEGSKVSQGVRGKWHSFKVSDPNNQLWHAKWKLSWNMHTLHARLCHVWPRFVCSVSAW